MHEMGIAARILEIASAYLPDDAGTNHVERINLKIGKLTGVVGDSLRFCFKIISEDTPFSKAEVKIEEVPVQAKCIDCRKQWTVAGPSFLCPICNSGNVESSKRMRRLQYVRYSLGHLLC